LVVLLAVAWGLKRCHRPSITVAGEPKAVTEEALYEKGDRPTTIFLKALAPSTGEIGSVPVVIHQSKSRLNQMKQATLAFLQGPSDKAWKSLAPKGVVLNQMYLTASGSAVVDLTVPSDEAFGFYEEARFASALAATLEQNFAEVKRVRLLNEGRESGTLTGHFALGTVERLSATTGGNAAP
jgi:hypothetical protein